MCLIAFAINASARWPLVIASNRDEFLDRPTEPLARWHAADGLGIVSGRDLRAGGTWLGATPGGRVAFLTNVREGEPVTAPLSRGSLVTDWLTSTRAASSFVSDLQTRPGLAAGSYGGFNLVVGDFVRGDWWWVSNRSEALGVLRPRWQSRRLEPGIYGLSNAALDTGWPKTMRLKSVLTESLAQSEDLDDLQTSLWAALEDGTRASAAQLPSTGVPPEREQALSSAFVDLPEDGYGTRGSTLLVATANPSTHADGGAPGWSVQILEREQCRGPRHWNLRSESLAWHAAAIAPRKTPGARCRLLQNSRPAA